MSVLNPMTIISMLANGNPQQVAQNIINQNFPNDPNMQMLLQMGLKNDTQGIQNFARQYLGQRGLDLDTEMSKFMSLLGRK